MSKNNKMSFSVLLIGAGQMGMKYSDEIKRGAYSSHYSSLVAHGGFKLAAIVDPQGHALEVTCPVYTRLAEARSGKYDLVVVSSPTETHYQVLKELVSDFDVKVILCEKPGAVTSRDLEEIAFLAEAKNIRIAINYTRRWVPFFYDLATEIRENLTSEARLCCYYTKGLLNYATHQINFLFLIDESWRLSRKLGGEGSPSFILENSNGTQAYFLGLETSGFEYEVWTIDAYLRSGLIQVRAGGMELVRGKPQKDLFFKGYTHLEMRDTKNAYHLSMKELYEEIFENLTGATNNSRCSIEDAIKVLRITDQIIS